MNTNWTALLFRMFLKFGVGFLIIGLLLFGCAGSLSYANGWVFIAALAVPMLLFGTFLLIKDPQTLARRLKSKEQDKSQQANISASGLLFITCFVLSGLDFRFGWSNVPFPAVVTALAVMLLGYGLFVAVILQNAYASRVVEVSTSQKIITTGLYSLVRHPMYTATILLFLAMPVLLGSYYALIPMLPYPAILVRRIKNEESLLCEQLEGYKEYTSTVPYRLIPFVW